MKPKLLIGVGAIVLFTSLLMYNFGNSISTYANFEQAENRAGSHVAGVWDDSREDGFSRETMQFSFHMKDEDGNVRRVVYSKPRSEEHTSELQSRRHLVC